MLDMSMGVHFSGAPFAGAILTRPGQNKLSMFHSTQAEHAIGHCPDLLTSALHDDHFQAIQFIEVDVGRRENHVVRKMLRLG